MSPTNRTVSEHSSGRNICGSIGMNGGTGLTVRSVSAATNTCAPAASAADLSIPLTLACARYERTNVRCSAPGSDRSST